MRLNEDWQAALAGAALLLLSIGLVAALASGLAWSLGWLP